MASKTSWRTRAFAIFFVTLFTVPIVAGAAYVVYEQSQGSTDSALTSSTQEETPTTVNNENALQGKPLANFTPITAPVTELQKIDKVAGTGTPVATGATVTVDYTGAVASTGTVFQSSLDSGQPVSFGLDQVIKGWTDGVPGMLVGGTRRLVIPADQAYGANPPAGSGIPANADLVFDITLKSVQ